MFRRQLGFNFLIVVEARPGPNNQLVGQGLPQSDDGSTLPDLLIQSDRALGNGSLVVCDKGPPPNIGGVPAVDLANMSFDSQAMRRALIDFGCRFQVHLTSDQACTINSLGNFRFATQAFTSQTVQFCFEPAVGTEVRFPSGRTVLRARVRDRQGGVGDPVDIVVEAP